MSVATPQLQKIKDKAVINDATDSFLLLNGKIIEVGEVAGNIRIVNFRINKGVLSVDSEGDKVIFSLENTNLKFSEPGSSIEEGDITYRTEEYGKRFTVSLDLTYEGFDITYKGNSELKVLHNGLHKIKLENQGFDEGSGKTKLDISLI
ncbi:hypothetical protein CMI42_04145 [Candidatus Pacearchaeota archaeon]|nr:hypothetical protein [Candidatus Pacearchaeota archaeon]